jgi:hypothetical protein
MDSIYWAIRFLLFLLSKCKGVEKMAGGNLIYGAISFVLGGLLGGYFAGRHFAKEYRQTIRSLQDENEQLRDQLQKKTEKSLAEREKSVKKAEKKIDKRLDPLRNKIAIRELEEQDEGKPSTAEIEKLSQEYRSEAFDAHFADRVAPDDSDDVGEEDDSEADLKDELTREEKRKLRKDGYLQRGNGQTLMTRPFAEAYAKASKNPVDFDSDDNEDPFVDIPIEDGDVKDSENLQIRMIDKETFKRDLEIKDSDTYTYYQEDGVLVNDITREVEPDQVGVLGKDVMEIIEDTEMDELYIDNEADDMLYDIMVDHTMSYYRDVLGM